MNEVMVLKQLAGVIDPELGIDIVSLGFIYKVVIDGNKGEYKIKVLMTLTTPACPLAGVIDRMVREAIAELEGVEMSGIEVEVTFDPPWTMEMMTEEARLELGFL